MTVTFSTENGHDGLLWDTLYDELSENPATGQTGWVIVTPFNWNIIYGLSTIELTPNSGPVGAFISEAKHQGVGPKFVVPEYALGGFAACLSCFAALGAFYVSKNRVKTNSVTTNALI
jgi:hypothetical protein